MIDSSPDARPELEACLELFRTLARDLPRSRLIRGVPNAAGLDWEPWSGADAMHRAIMDWVEYWRLAVKFLWKGTTTTSMAAPLGVA
jgi:hypothetical protein